MARDDGSAAGTVILAFVMGAVTGAAVALLMAPSSGEETRRTLGNKAREGRQRAEEAARQGREFINRQRETLNSAIERGREAYNQARGGFDPSQAPEAPESL
jgi:gas vesicle protein